ncbi:MULTISPECIES: hypothetical protein [Paenibacillus]|nr:MULTISPECIES: hypothetical protein [Paenibacillus]
MGQSGNEARYWLHRYEGLEKEKRCQVDLQWQEVQTVREKSLDLE